MQGGSPALAVGNRWATYQAVWPMDAPLGGWVTTLVSNTQLCDAWVYTIMHNTSISLNTRGQRWKRDFTARGEIRANRIPKGLTVWIEDGG